MSECQGRLLERVRRETASDTDRMALEAHMEFCDSCRLSVEVARDFDRVGVVEDDGPRVARLVQNTLAANRRSPARVAKKRRFARVMGLAAAALVVGGVAAAASLNWSRLMDPTTQEPTEPEKSPSQTPSVVHDEAPLPAPERSEHEGPPPVADSMPSSERPSGAVPAKPRIEETNSGAKKGATSGVANSPSALYRLANEARRNGEGATAIARYRELQRRFPASAEAALSRVSLGGLLLEGGQMSQALTQFERYLKGGSTRLAAEALYGRGRALGALGRQDEEAKNWRRLLSSYPDSPYSGEARRRLDALR